MYGMCMRIEIFTILIRINWRLHKKIFTTLYSIKYKSAHNFLWNFCIVHEVAYCFMHSCIQKMYACVYMYIYIHITI